MTGEGGALALKQALQAIVFGQEGVLEDLITACLARGHVLLEGVPGLAKTVIAKSFAGALGLPFARIQFTPDLMPSDVVGTQVFRPDEGTFRLVKGPVFTTVLLADEINRTPPKTQAALLEAMEERQVTLDGQTHPLDPAFFVIATQNPLELDGTYPLPEAQLDRFLMRIRIGYPEEAAERASLEAFHTRGGHSARVERVLDAAALERLKTQAAQVRADPSVIDYCLRLARATRADTRVRLGASPRATQGLLAASKSRAAMSGRDFVIPDDVKFVAISVLNHRLLLHAEAEVEGLSTTDILRETLGRVPVPR
jgi:MoxR-like ATPase